MLLNDFYTIESSTHNGRQYRTTVLLNKEHAIYQGHFPQQPVVPGVCMMMMVQETLSLALGKKLNLSSAKTVKFLGVVNPNEINLLTIDCEVVENPDNTFSTIATIYTEQQVFYKASCAFHPSI